ncbi:MAG: L,D-transpeptidase [Candidatus Hydrogenedentes bacterium]|nr:L,D-transpeptidase [Candidatus Hydrogenedentota bacterium]
MRLKAALSIGIIGLLATLIPIVRDEAIGMAGIDEPTIHDATPMNGESRGGPNGSGTDDPDIPVIVEISDPPMDILDEDIPPALTDAQAAYLHVIGWTERVGGELGVWVSVDEQALRVIQGGAILLDAPCATARNGVGSLMNSLKTPLGWHSVTKKLGEDAPWGQVFRSRQPTGEIWKAGGDTTEDLVLTRVLLLDGEEPGLNKGGNVDSMARFIYIHGTNDEANIGTPSSHGCIRLRNDDVIRAFEIIRTGAKVVITFDGGS